MSAQRALLDRIDGYGFNVTRFNDRTALVHIGPDEENDWRGRKAIVTVEEIDAEANV